MSPTAENDAPLERVQIFSEGSFTEGTLTWGWQCFRCRDEETGFGSATTAGEGRDSHETLGCVNPPEQSNPPGQSGVVEREETT